MSLFLLRDPRMFGGREAKNTLAYVKRLTERPAYATANVIAGPAAIPPSGV